MPVVVLIVLVLGALAVGAMRSIAAVSVASDLARASAMGMHLAELDALAREAGFPHLWELTEKESLVCARIEPHVNVLGIDVALRTVEVCALNVTGAA